jgi:hypothetical protein
VHAELADAPAAGEEKIDDGRGNRPGADNGGARNLFAAMQQLGRQRRRRRRARRTDVGAFEAGIGKPGRHVVEHDDRRGARQCDVVVGGEAGNPLDAGDIRAAAQAGRQSDDARAGLIGKAQKITVGIGRAAGVMQPIGLADQLHDLRPVLGEDGADVGAADDIESLRLPHRHALGECPLLGRCGKLCGRLRASSASKTRLWRAITSLNGPQRGTCAPLSCPVTPGKLRATQSGE